MQSDLEIPTRYSKMEHNLRNDYAVTRYKAIRYRYYKKPVDGKFEDITATILNDIDSDTDEEVVVTDVVPMVADSTN